MPGPHPEGRLAPADELHPQLVAGAGPEPEPLVGVDAPGRDVHAPDPLAGVPGQDLPAGDGEQGPPGHDQPHPRPAAP